MIPSSRQPRQVELDQLKMTYLKVQESIKNNKETQLFYKAFLRPIEIALKTYDTQSKNTNSQMKNKQFGCMPFGLKQVIKTNIDDNKNFLEDFEAVDVAMNKLGNSKDKYDINDIKMSFCDNLISLMKPSKQNTHGLKVAICICMYSQDKSMLKRTLAGVAQNISTFDKNGIPPNRIGVFVIMDGIQPVQESVEQLFEQFQKDNNIYLSDDVDATNPRDILDQTREIQDQQVQNLNHLIFTPEELLDRKKRRFAERRRQYKMYKKMISDIQKLEKQKILTFDSLDTLQQRFFFQKARQQWKKQYAASDDQTKNITQQVLKQTYAMNIKVALPLIRQALSETKKYCAQYISTRDNFALLNTFRISIDSSKRDKEDLDETKKSNIYKLNQQDEDKMDAKMNLYLVTKYKNRGKLSSHNWFFNGFCQQLKPQFAVLLDVGLVPQKQALWRMILKMQENKKVGGVCGYMGLRVQKIDDGQQIKDQNTDCITSAALRLFDIQKAQQFEYHFAHLIDKPFQSSFGFIHVLPGAFSAYRMAALRPSQHKDSQLLKQYFKSIDQAAVSLSYKAYEFTVWQTICKVALPDFMYGCFFEKPNPKSYEQLLYNQNVYLAQDRTLCMGIHQNKYDLVYLPDAYAWVDPIKTLYGLLGQRKRWINGSFFAFQKVKQTLDQQAGDCLLKLQIFYLTFMNMMSFVAPALFMYTIHIAMFTFQTNVILAILQQFGLLADNLEARQNNVVGIFVYIIDLIYVLIFLGLVFFSMHLTNRFNKFQTYFYGVSTTYGVFSLAVFGVLLYDIISGFASGKNAFLLQNKWFVDAIAGGQAVINSLRYIMIGIMGLYVIPVIMAIIYGRFRIVLDILFSTASFIFYSPTYLNILNIYALCRMDDISWGTKGLNAQVSGRKKQMTEQWKKIKLIHVSKFVLYNLITGFLLILFGDNYVLRFWFTFAIMIILGLTLAIKVILSTIYLISYRCCSSSSKPQQPKIKPTDPIDDFFKKVKQSLYEQIRSSIQQISKQVKQNHPNIAPSSVIMSSGIFKFLTNGSKQGKYKKRYKNEDNILNKMSKIQQNRNSKIYGQVKKAVDNPEPIPIQLQPRETKSITSGRRMAALQQPNMQNLSGTGTDQQLSTLQINQNKDRPVQNVPTKKRKNKAGL